MMNPKIKALLLLSLSIAAVFAFTATDFVSPEQGVEVTCPNDADNVSAETAADILSSSDGFFDEGCLMYHDKSLNKIYYLNVVNS